VRERARESGRAGLVQGLLQEFALSSSEGVALMCLAEALLRIPDAATRDALIRDKIAGGDWQPHLGQSPSLFVNAATWGLLLTGKLVATHSETGLSAAVGRVVSAGGEPLIRKGVDLALRMMGEQFVTGETIGQALRNAGRLEAEGFRYSYDMLGEAAMTAGDAKRYLREYENAIHAIGKASAGRGIYAGPGISIKLSALHPRYAFAQYERVMCELYAAVLELAQLARVTTSGSTSTPRRPSASSCPSTCSSGCASSPRSPAGTGSDSWCRPTRSAARAVIDFLIELARQSRRRLMVRLVKGAYWDSEIKRAQLDGQAGYPVFTRKAYTDVSYIACAKKLLAAPDAAYPQFATHNAQTVATIYHLAGPDRFEEGQYEFQCLHGMGEPLYEQVVGREGDGKLGRPCRIYAPVGTHETLLAYLVRRLLENGANTSFVNRIADAGVPIESLVQDPVDEVEVMAKSEGAPGLPHPSIPLPRDLYGSARRNSSGIDLASRKELEHLAEGLRAGVEPAIGSGQPVRNPADHRDIVGAVDEATPQAVDDALRRAVDASAAMGFSCPCRARGHARAGRRCARSRQGAPHGPAGARSRQDGRKRAVRSARGRRLPALLRRAGVEIRTGQPCTARPGGLHQPLEFPARDLYRAGGRGARGGQPVLAKPAEQTPLVASEAVKHLWRAGVPRDVVQLLPGRGEVVGDRLVTDERVKGVLFTGSNEVARILQRAVAGRLGEHGHGVPLIAETGGQNAMIVDSSALAEQVVADVVASAFDSAGQRCSALRVLCVQDDVATAPADDAEGAMARAARSATRAPGDRRRPGDRRGGAAASSAHRGDARARPARCSQRRGRRRGTGSFVLPTLIEIDRLAELEREVFGPVLHVLRYDRERLDALLGRSTPPATA
jgi:RHH-type proline utilization regulon transcriptional repressor/proline dehydrogenase/delta 1-pyrroline-5-carboxylate dehydrogenase